MKIEIKSIFGKVLFALEKENNTIKETLEEAVRNNTNLENADLVNANLRNANLINANLRNANLINANLRNADLINANLINANLINANLINANLRNANLEYANLEGVNLRNANLINANLMNANLEDVNLYNSSLENAKNKETAILPIYCKWSYGIKGNLIVIGCKEKTIEQWDLWFSSSEEYTTKRNTEDFKQIQAVYNALKAYYLTLNK